jgi:cell shape-determining protein MreC
MTYIRTSSRPNQRRSRLIASIAGGVVILVALIQIITPHFLPAFFTTIVRPFWRIEFSVASGSLSSPQALLMENEALKTRIQELTADNASAGSWRGQYAELLAALGRPELVPASSASNSATTSTSSISTSADISAYFDKNNSRILAAVLVRPPLAPYDELIIDVGADRNIVPGSKVYAPGNILIGTTSDVLGETSKVTLFSTPGQNYQVFIGPNHIPATAIGRGGGQYEAQVPQATTVNEGDVVSDGSLGDGIFGTVLSVINNPADPFITVLFAPPVNVYQLRWVFVANGDVVASNISGDLSLTNSQSTATTSRAAGAKTSSKKK